MKVIVNSFLLFFLFSGQVFGDGFSNQHLNLYNYVAALPVDSAPALYYSEVSDHFKNTTFHLKLTNVGLASFVTSTSDVTIFTDASNPTYGIGLKFNETYEGGLEDDVFEGNTIGPGEAELRNLMSDAQKSLPTMNVMGGVAFIDLYIAPDLSDYGDLYTINNSQFSSNSIRSAGNTFGGAIAAISDTTSAGRNLTLEITNSYFKNNTILNASNGVGVTKDNGEENYAAGGALFNLFSIINVGGGGFSENSVTTMNTAEGAPYARGGAIANYGGNITLTGVKFENNCARSEKANNESDESKKVAGGAIYNVNYKGKPATLTINGGNFSGNYTEAGGKKEPNDIYNEKSTINLKGNVVFDGGIDGNSTSATDTGNYEADPYNRVVIHDGTTTLKGDAAIKNNVVNMENGTLKLIGSDGKGDGYFQNALLTIQGNVIFSLENGGNNSATFDKVNGVSGNPIKLDIDIEENMEYDITNGGPGKILPDSIKGSFSNAEFKINGLKLDADYWFRAERTVLNLDDVVTDNNGAAVGSLFPDGWWNDEIAPNGVLETSIYKYGVEVDTANRRVTFIRPNISRPDSYPGYLYNETVSMRSLADVDHYIIRNILSDTNFKFNLKNENAVANRRRSNRRSNRRRSRVKPQEESRPSVWFDMLGLKDTVKYDNFHSVDDNSMTAILGVNSKTQRLANGAEGYGNLYLGYLYSEQKYDTNKIESNGVYIGGSGFMSYNSLFGGVTANIGFMSNEAKNKWGKDSYDNYWLSLGTKIGYDYRIRNTGYSLEPALYLSYVFVSGDVYTSKSGEKINQNDLHSFQIAPSLRLSKAFKDNLLLSLRARYVFEMVNDLDVEVRNVSLPELDSDPFVEYGISVDKKFRNSFSIGAELNRRDGGRDGWNGGLNAKFFF